MQIHACFDTRTNTLTYIVFDEATKDALVIDPVLDYDNAASKVWTESVDCVVAFVAEQQLKVHYLLETHAHADHLSGSQALKEHFPAAQTAIGANITEVQALFKGVFDLPRDFPTDGSQFDRLIQDNETITAGSLSFRALFTPGHTPACASYVFDDVVFTGDALFMPDMGTGRCDFPGGSAEQLYDSITQRIYTLPESTRVHVGHDYQPGGRELKYEATIAEHKASNKQLPAGRSKAEFVAARKARDAELTAPKLLFQSVQVNIDAGSLPKAHENDVRYLRIPINVFRPVGDSGAVELRNV